MKFGPTLQVNIGFDPLYVKSQSGMPKPGITGLAALVDTGAYASCIDSSLATRLNLPIIDRCVVSGVHGPGEVNVHLAQIHVPLLGFTIFGEFAAVDLLAGGQPHHALIGRTFLMHVSLAYDGKTGAVSITY